MHVTILGVVCAVALLGSVASQCPKPNCRYHPKCTVSYIQSKECLVSAVQGLRTSVTLTVIFDNLDLPEGLPAGIFNETKLKSITFKRFKMKSLNSSSSSPFSGMQNTLKQLKFLQPHEETVMTDWFWGHINILKLEHVVLSHISPLSVGSVKDYELSTNFKNLGDESLSVVEITSNCLTILQDFSLSTFKNVKTINLSGNRIVSLKRNVFPKDPRYLTTIDLSGNRIKTLAGEDELFWDRSWPNLKNIYLDGNLLISVSAEVLPRNLSVFYLNDNLKLECNCALKWTKEIDVKIWQRPDGNKIKCDKPRKLTGKVLSGLTLKEICPRSGGKW